MIVWILIAGVALLTTVFITMPPFPATPPYFNEMSNNLADILQTGIQFIRYVLTPELTYFVLFVFAGLLLSEHIYHGIMWVLRKIPVLGIN